MVAIYQKFIDEAKEKGCEEIYFKEHPREDVEYEKHFPDSFFIPKLMPIEILNLDSNVAFDQAYTICSGSIDNLKNVNFRKNLGRDFLKKL